MSGKEKEPKPKLVGPDILRWGGGVGAEKFGMSLETRETKLFWRDTPGFAGISRNFAAPQKFEKQKFVFNVWPLLRSRRSKRGNESKLGKKWSLKFPNVVFAEAV